MRRLVSWRKTVAGKTALGIVVPLLLVFGGFLAYGLTVRQAQAHREVVDSHSHHAMMLQQLLRETTRATGGHDMRGLVAAVREAERYSEVVITDWRGEIRHAKNPALVGQRLERGRPECGTCHGPGEHVTFAPRTLEVVDGSSRVLRTVVPLRNDKDCHRCHDARRTVNGIAVLEAPMAELDAAVDRLVWETILTAFALLFVAVVAVYTVQHRLVVRPLSQLTARARAVEQGGPRTWPDADDDADDEVGQLAAAFRRMVERLAEAHLALEDKVRVRTEALSEMGEELERLNAQLMHVERLTTMGELAATIAHEVRTPLNALAINLQLLKRELRKNCPSASAGDELGERRTRDTVSIIEGEIARINAVIEEFMKYARLQPPRLRPVELLSLSRKAIQLLELEAKREGVALTFSSDQEAILIRADEDRLRQVLINLVINALQAVSRGGRVDVTVGRAGGHAFVCVRDDGPGIDAEHLGDLFKPFVTTKEKGTGLGLAIVSRIVKQHHGTVTASNHQDGGACFEVRLPFENEDEAGRGA